MPRPLLSLPAAYGAPSVLSLIEFKEALGTVVSALSKDDLRLLADHFDVNGGWKQMLMMWLTSHMSDITADLLLCLCVVWTIVHSTGGCR